jgi:hypothetical protein
MDTRHRDEVVARLDALEQQHVQLQGMVAQLEMRAQAPATAAAAPPRGTRVSRRGMLTGALGAAAATIGAGAVLDATGHGTAAAASGSPLTIGQPNLGEAATQIAYDGATRPIAGKVVFLVNDSALAGAGATYPAALGSGGVGVRAASSLGTAVIATTASTAPAASAIQGLITSTSPGAFSAGVLGQNAGTTSNGIGVYGVHHSSGVGVYVVAPSGTGVVAVSTSGPGIQAYSETNAAVIANAGSGAGLAAYSGSGTAVSAFSSSGMGVDAFTYYAGAAVRGTNANVADNAIAVEGVISSTNPGSSATAVRGVNNGTGGNGVGVWGSQAGSGYGVLGTSVSSIGVYGRSTSGDGVFGYSLGGIGVLGQSDSAASGARGLYGVISSSNAGSSSAGVRGQNNGTGSAGIGVYGAQNGSGYGVYGYTPSGYGVVGSSGNGLAVFAIGDFAATGTKAALVPAADGLHRTLYCLESPECWFEDFGSGALVGGRARVPIDPAYAATVHTDQYYVFLVPEGECTGLYVQTKDATGFTVQELQGGTSSLAFSYRIVARRKDVTAPRLAPVSLNLPPADVPELPAQPAPAVPQPSTVQTPVTPPARPLPPDLPPPAVVPVG